MIAEVDKPDIVTVIESETGSCLRKTGKNLVMQCPLHDEKTPSLTVNPDKQVWYCHGCHEGGDVFTFIEKFKGLTFKDALRYLGIENDGPYKPNPEVQRKRDLVKAFRQWEMDYFDEVSTLYRVLNKLKLLAKTQEEVDSLADFYKAESVWEHHMDILTFGSDEEKFLLFREVVGK
jgi:DNA primase